MSFSRISTAHFIGRVLTVSDDRQRLKTVINLLCGLWTLSAVVVMAVRKPFATPWQTVVGSAELFQRWIAIETTGIIIDLGTLAMAVFFIWRLHMPVGKRLFVCMIFGSRLLVVPIVIARLWTLRTSSAPETMVPIVPLVVLTEAEMQLALFLASITRLKPFLQPFYKGYGISTNANIAVTGYSVHGKSRGKAYYQLSHSGSQGISRTREIRNDGSKPRPASSDNASDQVELIDAIEMPDTVYRADGNHYRATAGRKTPMTNVALRDATQIQKTQTYSISYK
ncbi:hypothetical protein LTR86_008783 [Recurvomyces mirabilis]|nr:hypothetical protein LTR86_008783 [Recurvomyces mirabilis]